VASVFREGLAQLRFRLCGQIAGDQMSIHVFESALDLTDDGVVVSKNNADVPGVTFCFTSSMNSSLIPMSMIDVLQAPSAAPTAAPRSGTRKINPRNMPRRRR
jgi:hypothetical protein